MHRGVALQGLKRVAIPAYYGSVSQCRTYASQRLQRGNRDHFLTMGSS